MSESPERIRFGPFVFDPSSGELAGPAETVRLAPQVAAVLQMLTSRPGEVVGRAELHEKLWPDTTVEFDQGLNFCIRQLRLALSDDAEHPAYIETLPRRGYRFVAQVVRAEEPAPVVTAWSRAQRGAFAGTALVLLVALALAVFPHGRVAAVGSDRAQEVLAVLRFDLDPSDTSLGRVQANLVEQLVASLTRDGAGSLAVMGPSFTGRFPGMRTYPDSLRSALGATYALSGAIRRMPAGTRIFAQLIRLGDRKHVFGAVQFDSTNSPARLTEIGDSISRAVRGVIAANAR